MANQLPPVLFLIFSRPSTTEIVFEQIRKARPTKLFIAADGPRKNKVGELEKCLAARAIVSKVDWECEVKTLFRDENLGCGRAVSGAINWFFDHVEEGIILEDDTNPSPDFFKFCAEMLEYYRDDIRVMEIGGSTLPNRLSKNSQYSYFFSDWDYIWGWATWKRAWKHYDYSMKHYPEVTARGYLLRNYTSRYERHYMEYLLSRSHYQSDSVTFWDIQWGFARKINSGLVVVPTKNMVVNLGFGIDATNTTNSKEFNFMTHEKMEFPLRHPEFIMQDRVTDKEVFIRYSTSFFSRLRGRLKSLVPAWFYDFFKNLSRRYFSFFLLDEYLPGMMGYLL